MRVHGNQTAQTEQAKEANKTQQAKKTDKNKEADKTRGVANAESGRAVGSEISAKAKDAARAHKIAASTPDVREDKVAELKKRIADGNYRVDADKVADRMVDEHMRF